MSTKNRKKPQKITLKTAIDGHLLHVQSAFSPCTYADYEYTHRQFTAFVDPQTPFSDITVENLQQFMIHITNAPMGVNPMTKKVRAGKRSPKTLANIHIGLSALWSWAVGNGYADENIMHRVAKVKITAEPIRPLTATQLIALLNACDETSPWKGKPDTTTARYTANRDKAIVALLAECGLRVSELCNLKRKDVQLDKTGGKVYVQLGKGNKSREVYFSRRCAKLLHTWMISRAMDDESPFFIGLLRLEKQAITVSGVQQLIKRLGRKIGIHVTPHVLRHTAATLMAKNGATALQLQRTLGHSTINMSMKYVELSQLDMANAVKHFSPLDNMKL